MTTPSDSTKEMLHALDLSVASDGSLWSVKNGHLCQKLHWTAEEAIAYVVGKMLDENVREKMPHSDSIEPQ